jgi:hypothetical protein
MQSLPLLVCNSLFRVSEICVMQGLCAAQNNKKNEVGLKYHFLTMFIKFEPSLTFAAPPKVATKHSLSVSYNKMSD